MDFATRFGNKVSRCESIIGYVFKSKTLCGEALNAAGDHMSAYTLDGVICWMPKNDRLAVYGDTVADSHLCNLWFEKSIDKQGWDVIRKAILANNNLARVGRDHGLHECIVSNDGTTTSSARRMIATAVEAILGAVRRDGGDAPLAGVMGRLGLTQHALLSPVPLRPALGFRFVRPPESPYDFEIVLLQWLSVFISAYATYREFRVYCYISTGTGDQGRAARYKLLREWIAEFDEFLDLSDNTVKDLKDLIDELADVDEKAGGMMLEGYKGMDSQRISQKIDIILERMERVESPR